MQVLHIHWQMPRTPGEEAGLFLWAENATAPQPKRDRRKKAAQTHPFLLGSAAIRQLVEGAVSWRGYKVRTQALTFWLPTDRFGPVPSPYLIHDWETDQDQPRLHPWLVDGLFVEAATAFRLLTALVTQPLPRITLGSGSRYWQHATNLVLEILAQQKLRPTMIELREGNDLRYEARWQPMLDGEEDARRLTQLAASMPPILRADAPTPEDSLPPRALLDSFLNHLCDAGARAWSGQMDRKPPADAGPAERWQHALLAKEAAISGSTAQLQHLYSSYRAWARTLTVAGDRHVRVALRLQAPPPKAKQDRWQLHYLLQARDDASLLIPAAEVWQSDSGVLEALGRRFERPQERLLAGLGYAGRFSPPVRKSLDKRNPTGVSLTAQEAFDFLRECAPHLERSGFGLLTPPWWNKPGAQLGVRLHLGSMGKTQNDSSVSKGHLSMENLVRFRWELSIGDTALTQEEFFALVALKSPLVQIRGQWVQLDPEQIEAAIRFWERQKDLSGEMSLYEAMQLGLGSEDEHNGLSIDSVEMDAWLNNWLDTLRGDESLALLPPPDDLHATLRPYQQYGYSWLHFARRWGMGVILADDMGLGKTIQTLALVQQLKDELGGLPVPILLICPTSVVTNWQIESQKFTPGLRTLVHQGGDRLRGDDFVAAAQDTDMVFTSYALVRRDEEAMRAIDWMGIVLDEAQNIKNAGTKQARIIRDLSAGFRLALTGTPVENRLAELWSIMQFLNPGFLGAQKPFRQRFVLPIEKNGDENAVRMLRKLTSPFILRRVKTDPTVITDLPEKQEVKVYCNLSEEQATLYEAVVHNAITAIDAQEDDNIQRKGMVLSMLMQLKQVCNHPVQYLHQAEGYNPFEDNNRSGKLQRFHALLDEVLAEGDRLLLFTQFTEMGGLLRQYIQERFGTPTLYLHGGVPAKKRAEMVERFQAADGPPVFILSLKAGGTGLNLTNANHVFHYDRWWNPAVEDQATDRAFRIGQTRNVLVHKFVCLGTLEERIDQMLEEKKALAESVVGGGENWLTEMSTADLRELVKLRETR